MATEVKKIQFRQGNKADLVVANLLPGEPVLALDTNEVGIKTSGGAILWFAMASSGTFTPSLKGSTTAGVFTYYDQMGQYTVIGNICIAQIKVEINQITTPATGNLTLVGLPKIGVGVPYTDIAGKIAGLSFIGAVNTNHGAIYVPNVTGYVDASTLKSTDGFTCTLVYRC